jgi:hypothetical protein
MTPEQFRDWHEDAFGYGYGTGEERTLPAVKAFFWALPREGAYDYQVLEATLTPVVAWLLINILCRTRIIEYGASPRFGWLTEQGEEIRHFLAERTADQLYEIVCGEDFR